MSRPETLLERAERGVQSSKRFIAHLQEQVTDATRAGDKVSIEIIKRVITSVQELLTFEEETVRRLQGELQDDALN